MFVVSWDEKQAICARKENIVWAQRKTQKQAGSGRRGGARPAYNKKKTT